MKKQKFKVMLNTPELVQMALPDGASAQWCDGKIVVTGKGRNDLTKEFFSMDCPSPTFTYDECGNLVPASKSGPFNLSMGEVAVAVSVPCSVVGMMGKAFTEGKPKIPDHQLVSRIFLDGKANLELAEAIIGQIDRFYKHGCTKVVVVYRTLPTCIPCDESAKFGAVAFAQLAMLGME